MFGIIVTGSEQRSDSPGKPIIGRQGEKYWVVIEPEGWVPATSTSFGYTKEPPKDLKVWENREEAEKFAKKWKGHPWWCSPISYEIIEVEPKYKEVFDGYKIIGG